MIAPVADARMTATTPDGGRGGPGSGAPTHDSHKVLGNALSLGTAEILLRVVAFVAVAYLSRVLTPEGFGVLAFATAVTGYLAIAVRAGFGRVAIPEVARDPEGAYALAAGATVIRVGIAVLALGALAAGLALVDMDAVSELVILLSGVTLVSQALDTSWVYKGLERGTRFGLVTIGGQLLYVGLVVLLVSRPEHVVRVPVAQAVGETAAALALLIPLLWRAGRRIHFGAALAVFRKALAPTFTTLLRTLIFTFDILLLGAMLTPWHVGIYGAAYRLIFLLVSISAALQVSYLPAIARAERSGPHEASQTAARLLELSLAVAAPLVVGGAVIAEPLLTTLFGAEYGAGANAFRVLLLSVACIFVYGAVSNLLVTYGRLRTEMWIMTGGVCLNVVLNLLLIPRLGILGAAISTAAAELMILAAGLSALRHAGLSIREKGAVRPLLAAAVMAATIVLFGTGRPLVVQLLVGAVSYAIALRAVGGVPRDLRTSLRHLAARERAT